MNVHWSAILVAYARPRHPPSPSTQSAIASFLLRNPSLYVIFLCAVFWHQSSLPLGYLITWWGWHGGCRYGCVGGGCRPGRVSRLVTPTHSLLYLRSKASSSKLITFRWLHAGYFLFSTNGAKRNWISANIISQNDIILRFHARYRYCYDVGTTFARPRYDKVFHYGLNILKIVALDELRG